MDDTESWVTIAFKAGLLLGLLYLTSQLLTTPRPWTLLDAVNLVFHEAGHIIFFLGGQFISMLGGSLLQILIPALVTGYFWHHSQWFNGFVGLYWVGESLINLSVYIKDARSLTLDLMGGGFHDWQWLLTHLGLLTQDRLIGTFVAGVGMVCVIGALSGLVVLLLQSIILKTVTPSSS